MEKNKTILSVFVWVVIALASDLPNILIVKLAGVDPVWMSWAKIGMLVVALMLSLLLKALRPLWGFAFVFLVFFLVTSGVDWVRSTNFWQSRFEYEGVAHLRYPVRFMRRE